ncbi:acyltransferase family protein [Glycomyces halotolerans]
MRPPRPERWEGTGFRPDIQGMRAIAVTLVLLSHAGFTFASGGYVGVDVFFVLSGFLITSLLIKEVFDTGTISLADFFSRRARRILPAAGIVLIATVVASWLWFPVTRLEAVMQDAFTVIVYAVNFRFIIEQTEYLNADQMPSPFQQYWSLAVEEQFYLVWPLLLLCLLVMAKRAPRRALNMGVGVVLVVFVLSLITSVLVTESSPTAAFYAPHTRAWELAGGALLAMTLPYWKRTPKSLAAVLGVIGLVAVLASALLYTDRTPFPGYTALLPVCGTMLLIIAGTAPGGNLVSSMLSTAPFQFVGKISYSLYLWHWPVLILAPLALGVEPSLSLNVILLTGTFALSQFSYAYIETPIRTAAPLKKHPFYGIAAGVACSFLGLAMILVLTIGFPKAPHSSGPTDLTAIEEFDERSDFEQRLVDGLEIDEAPSDLVPELASIEDDKPAVYYNGCHLGFDEVELPEGCWSGGADADTTVVLFGDSHAAQWFPAFDAIAEENGWALLTRTKSSCTPVSVAVLDTQENPYGACDDWRREVFAEMAEIKPDLVVVTTSDNTKLAQETTGDGGALWEEGWATTLAEITPHARNVVTLNDTPLATGMPAPECIAINQNSVGDCYEDPYIIAHTERRYAAQVAQEDAGVISIDTESWFCFRSQCPIIVENVLVYRDGNHMTTVYAKSLAGLLEKALPQDL